LIGANFFRKLGFLVSTPTQKDTLYIKLYFSNTTAGFFLIQFRYNRASNVGLLALFNELSKHGVMNAFIENLVRCLHYTAFCDQVLCRGCDHLPSLLDMAVHQPLTHLNTDLTYALQTYEDTGTPRDLQQQIWTGETWADLNDNSRSYSIEEKQRQQYPDGLLNRQFIFGKWIYFFFYQRGKMVPAPTQEKTYHISFSG
jgi:hypothetical protein